MGIYFKVTRKDLTSLGLLGAHRIKYKIGKWMKPKEPLSNHPRKGGGLWVVKKKSDALRIKKYMMKNHGVQTRIFICKIRKILYETSYRTKTAKVFLTEEIRVPNG